MTLSLLLLVGLVLAIVLVIVGSNICHIQLGIPQCVKPIPGLEPQIMYYNTVMYLIK